MRIKQVGSFHFAVAHIIVFFLFFGFILGTVSSGSGYCQSDGNANSETTAQEFPSYIFWSKDSRVLYFFLKKPAWHKNKILEYDLLTKETRVLYSGQSVVSPAVNEFREMLAPTHKNPQGDLCLISAEGNRFYDIENINQIALNPAWLQNSTDAVFHACGPGFCDVFLWNKGSGSLKTITPFKDETSDEYEICYSYFSFSPSAVPGRVIFGYDTLKVQLEPRELKEKLYYIGAMDVESGKAWKVWELSEFRDQFLWFSSETEDAIYFFKWDESDFLDSLWKIKSDGTGKEKVLDAESLPRAKRQGTIVSWSNDGRKIALKCHRSGGCAEDKIVLINTVTGELRDLGPRGDRCTFSSLSPDGTTFACVSDSELWLLDLESGTEEKVYPEELEEPNEK